MSFNKEALIGRWIHSREEDTKTGMVFRPSDYDFPLTRRPRESFELRDDGELIKGRPAASDRVEKTAGTWKLEDNDQLAFYDNPAAPAEARFKVVSVDKDRLIVRKD